MLNRPEPARMPAAAAGAGAGAMAQAAHAPGGPVEWVVPLMGTHSADRRSGGASYPALGVPWGEVLWSAQTGTMGERALYTYGARQIRGFRQMRQASPGMDGDAGFALMPVTGRLRFDEEERASWFSHKAERAQPHYYRVYLADADVTAEIAPAGHAAQFRFTFPKTEHAYVVIDALDKGAGIRIMPQQRKVSGYSSCRRRGSSPEELRNYFVMVFDKPFSSAATFSGAVLARGVLNVQGAHAGAVIGFSTSRDEQVRVRVASSLISAEQAELNLERELGSDSFDDTMTSAAAAWNEALGRIAVEGGTADQTRTFYTSLYRSLLLPERCRAPSPFLDLLYPQLGRAPLAGAAVTWAAPLDSDALIQAMGGRQQCIARLDAALSSLPLAGQGDGESAVAGPGAGLAAGMDGNAHDAHRCQAIEQLIYLYNGAGAPWKTQYWVREAMNRLYGPAPYGYRGHGDPGQAAAWYLFSALGCYPLAPALDQVALGAPLFKKVTLRLENGKTVVLNAPKNSAARRYVKAVRIDGQAYPRTWLPHATLANGAVIDIDMDTAPNLVRGSGAGS